MKTSIAVACLLASVSLQAQMLSDSLYSSFKKQSRDILITNVNVIPMDSNVVLINKDVLITNGKIASITPHNILTTTTKNTTIIDAHDKYLIPGLCDCHAHFYEESDTWLFLVNGITGLRVMSGNEELLQLRNKINKGLLIAPYLYVASPMLSEDETSYFDFAETKEDFEDVVQMCKTARYDYIKIGMFASLDNYTAVSKKCILQNIRLVGHPPINADVSTLIKNKQYSVEHMYLFKNIKPTDYSLLANNTIWICPTLSVYNETPQNKNNWSTIAEYKYLSSSLLKEWTKYKQDYTTEPSCFNKLYDAWKHGAKIVTGTDCRTEWVVPGFSIHTEMQLLHKLGIPNYDILKMATINSATMLETDSKTGTITVGKIANLVLLNKNPLDNIANTNTIETVILNGYTFEKTDIQDILNELEKTRNK